MKKVFIYAYMAGNLGDDLLIWILCRRYPTVQFCTIADPSYKKRFERLSNLTVYSPEDKVVKYWNRFFSKVKKSENGFWKMKVKLADATVHIGGSVFVQHFDDYSAFYNMDVMLRRLSKKMYVVGANFGPYTDENYYKQYYELLKTYDGVSIRDMDSYHRFEELSNVIFAPDVAFQYGRMSDVQVAKEKKQVLISVIDLKNRGGKFPINQYYQEYQQFLIKLTEAYIEKGYDVKFVSFCSAQGDENAIQDIIAEVSEEKKTKIAVYLYDQNIEECIRLFEESEIVVGTRFHSVILGWLKKKKVLPIVYDLKTLHTLQDNQCHVYVTLEELQDIKVSQLIERVEQLPSEQVDALVTASEGQFAFVDKLLG